MCFDHQYADVYYAEVRRARKPHICNDCYEKIQPGELYLYISGIGDDGPFTAKVCGACELTRLRMSFHEIAEGCEGDETICPVGELQEWLIEYDDWGTSVTASQRSRCRRVKRVNGT